MMVHGSWMNDGSVSKRCQPSELFLDRTLGLCEITRSEFTNVQTFARINCFINFASYEITATNSVVALIVNNSFLGENVRALVQTNMKVPF